jgi:DNA-binding response OmpR family regulator
MRRVLVVDDEPVICDTVAAFLKEWPGTEVVVAMTGKVGAETLRDDHFDLALIDALLPGLSGITLANLAANDHTPVLLFSGHPEVNEKLERFGCPHLEKPFSLEKLLDAAEHAVATASENIRRVKLSAAKIMASAEPLTAAQQDTRPADLSLERPLANVLEWASAPRAPDF